MSLYELENERNKITYMNSKEKPIQVLLDRSKEELVAEIGVLRNRIAQVEEKVFAVEKVNRELLSNEQKHLFEINKNKDFWKLILDTLPVTVYVNDTNKCVWINSNSEHNIGYTQTEWLSQSKEDFESKFHPDDRFFLQSAYSIQGLSNSYRKLKPKEMRIKQKDGSWKWLLSQSSVVLDNKGEPEKLIGLAIDITDRKQAEDIIRHHNIELEKHIQARTEQLRIALSKLKETDKIKSTILHNLSHELRTPLNGILGFAQILRDCVTDSESQEYINSILISGDRLKNTLNSLLSYTELQTGEITLNLEYQHLPTVLQKFCYSFDEILVREDVEIIYSILDEKIFAQIDSFFFHQVIFNLIDNALKFTHNGFITIEIDSAVDCGKNIRNCAGY